MDLQLDTLLASYPLNLKFIVSKGPPIGHTFSKLSAKINLKNKFLNMYFSKYL